MKILKFFPFALWLCFSLVIIIPWSIFQVIKGKVFGDEFDKR